jgi:pimeloyl-ACP methyl ester carboxylesterase
MRRVSAAVAALAAVALVAAVSYQPAHGLGRPGLTPVPCPTQAWEPVDPTIEALAGARVFTGRYSGGVYQIEIPEKWNGELMLSAHGFRANSGTNGSRLEVQPPAIRKQLIDGGFAWAASSYRCNGYVPGMGLEDTMALTGLFTEFNGGTAPSRVYLTGTSMGGHVTLLGMHEFPTSFAGGLAMCPAGPELFDFFTASAAAAEAITGIRIQGLSTLNDDLTRIEALLGTPPNYTEKGRQLASVQIQLTGGPRPFAMEGLGGRFTSNLRSGAAALAGGTSPGNRAVSTTHIRYSLDESLGLSSDRLNQTVRRKAADHDVRNPMGPHEEVVPFDGKIERPLLTMHGTGDLFVPIHLQQILNRAVVAAGRQELLVQRIYRIPGHCRFSVEEQWRAFDDLVQWVRAGKKPAGDNVMGDLRNAGTTFTQPRREGDPGTLTVSAQRSQP